VAGPRRILVTGASGFVGQHLMPALRATFPSAALLAAAPVPVDSADSTLPLELLDPQSIRDCVEIAQADVVIHMAAEAFVANAFKDPMKTWRINVDGSLLLAQAMMAATPDALLLFISSAEIYGLTFQSGRALNEDAPFAPANPYAASKAAADLALGEMALRGLRLVRMRPANHTGPGQTDKFAVPAFARQAARIEAGLQERIMHVGAVDRWRDFLDVRDVCAAYIAAIALGDQLPPGVAFNIGSGTPRRIGDILDTLIGLIGGNVEIQTDAGKLRPTDVMTAAFDPARARALLGWGQTVPWDKTLTSVLDDWRGRVG
jgi:GDP-4-dehydro-6-deoxy-D-mannose reductase